MTRAFSLDGDWDLWYFPEGSLDVSSPAGLPGSGAARLTGTVPGNVELDLVRGGVLPEPFVGENVFRLRGFETYEWWYLRRFTAPAELGDRKGKRAFLVFHGLDCIGTVWLNGKVAGEAANMFVPHSFEVTGLLEPENEVAVRIRSATLAARRMDYPAGTYAMATNHEQLRVRKAPHMYGWDIAPRIVSAGLWRSVALELRDPDGIDSVYYHTREVTPAGQGPQGAGVGPQGLGAAVLEVHWKVTVGNPDLSGYTLRFEGACGDDRFAHEVPVRFVAGTEEIRIPAARLWWPRGYGEPALYDVSCQLRRDGAVVDSRAERIGLRRIELRRTDLVSDADPGEFLFICNGERVMCRGTNWVPLDAFHSRDAGRLPAALALLEDIGCTMVRCWGGNVYEDHPFFDFCDQKGILVWQDFAFACALYPQDEEFHAHVRDEAARVVRDLRNHASLALWAGDNEIDIFAVSLGRDPSANEISRRVLPGVCAAEDPGRPYLPSSPYVSPEAFRRGAADQRNIPEQHLWGPRDYYKSRFYTESTAHFASEIGYHGCPNVSSIRRFIDQARLWPWKDNPQWLAHATDPVPGGGAFGYRIKLMADQVRELFGQEPEGLEDFAFASQVSQAEAKKFFIEMFRLARWRRTGIIWWNLIDCWPQFSDAVVDYYGGRKLAYWYIRRSQAPVLLMAAEPEDKRCRIVAANDTRRAVSGVFSVTDADSGKTLLEGTLSVPPGASSSLGSLDVGRGQQGLFVLRWTVGTGGQARDHGSHYLLGKPPFSLARYRSWLPAIASLPGGFDAAAIGR
jgi:beta-mannosidase